MFGVEIVFWHWWVLGLVFLVFEMLASAYFFLWLGACAGAVGLLLLIFPAMSANLQFGLWSIFAVISITGWYLHRKKTRPAREEENLALNERGKQYVGRKFTLEEAIINGEGKIRVDDSTWKVESETDFDAGVKVEVTGVDGTVLTVTEAA